MYFLFLMNIVFVTGTCYSKCYAKQGVLNSQECQDFSVNKELKSFRVRNLLVKIHELVNSVQYISILNKGR